MQGTWVCVRAWEVQAAAYAVTTYHQVCLCEGRRLAGVPRLRIRLGLQPRQHTIMYAQGVPHQLPSVFAAGSDDTRLHAGTDQGRSCMLRPQPHPAHSRASLEWHANLLSH